MYPYARCFLRKAYLKTGSFIIIIIPGVLIRAFILYKEHLKFVGWYDALFNTSTEYIFLIYIKLFLNISCFTDLLRRSASSTDVRYPTESKWMQIAKRTTQLNNDFSESRCYLRKEAYYKYFWKGEFILWWLHIHCRNSVRTFLLQGSFMYSILLFQSQPECPLQTIDS